MEMEYTADLKIDFGPQGNDLIPVVVQDTHSREVLILAYVNAEAFQKTRETKLATFYSRSRKTIWVKGSTSGDYLEVMEIRINCEQNSLLLLVVPKGKGACHAKKPSGDRYESCFYRSVAEDNRLTFISSDSEKID